MKISKLKKERVLHSWNSTSESIQSFGERNDYPQEVIEILFASVTGYNCVSVYNKFLQGIGLGSVGDVKVNHKQTFNDLLKKITYSMALFNGFYLHFNYNALYQITSITCLPFDCMRLGNVDNITGKFYTYAYHPDWGHRRMGVHWWNRDDIVSFDKFNPTEEAIDYQVKQAGGWDKWKGQVFYYNPEGSDVYALPIYRAALTDMSTEAGLCNVSYRSVRTNFITSGLLVSVGGNNNDTEEQAGALNETLSELQGDMNACKIATTEVQTKDDMPTFVDLKPTNFDKEYAITNTTIKDRIGRSFMQPPILRSEDVGNNFGATIIENAYTLYNSITSTTRREIETVLNKILTFSNLPVAEEITIKPLEFKKTYNAGELANLVNAGVITGEDVRKLLHLI